MSSSNNNKKNDNGGKHKEQSDTLDNGVSDEKKPPASLTFQKGTHGNGKESSFFTEKRLIAGRSLASRQMQTKVAPRFLKKEDPDVTMYPPTANMSDSNNISYQDNQTSSITKVSKVSHAKATLLTPVSRQMQTKVAPGYSEKEDPDVTMMYPVTANMSDSNNIMYQDKQKSSTGKISHAKNDILTTAGRFYANSFAEELKEEELEKQAHPGAYQVEGLRSTQQHDSSEHIDIEIFTDEVVGEHGQLEPAQLFKAELVVEPELASASVVDVEAEEKALFQRQVRNALVIFLIIGILVSIIAIPIELTKKPNLVETDSPTASIVPSFAPSDFPSASPSSSLFGFLAAETFDGGLALANPGSSQQKAMSWLEKNFRTNPVMDFKLLQFYVLVVLYYETAGKRWSTNVLSSSNGQWLQPITRTNDTFDFCLWKGILCNGTNITSLNLSGEGLVGSIPPEIAALGENLRYLDLSDNTILNLPSSFSDLSNLESLNCSFNIIAQLPSFIGNLTNLISLDLSDNVLLSGNISLNWSQLSKLQHLNLGIGFSQQKNGNGNSLSGIIPTDLGLLSSLTFLSLSRNQLTGTIPTEIGGLTNLTYLDLIDNAFTDSLFTEIGTLTNLNYLLWDNSFTGALPTDIENLTSLLFLYLYSNSNSFHGTLPSEIGLLTSLKALYLYSDSFSGTLPTEIGFLTSLNDLDLGYSVFNGIFPTEIGHLTSLNYLELYSNLFTGTLPTEIGRLTSLYYLSAYRNKFTGTLPKEIGLLTSLNYLFLFSNSFTGTLPTEIGFLSSLTDLSLSSNTFDGTLPTEIGLLTSLTKLYLFDNQLIGVLPAEIGNLTILNDFEIHSNMFTGAIPTEIGLMSSLTILSLDNNNFAGTVPTEACNIATIQDIFVCPPLICNCSRSCVIDKTCSA